MLWVTSKLCHADATGGRVFLKHPSMMEHIQMNDIYQATIRCDEGFEQSISKIQGGKFALREFQQRFWAWATNAGALAEPCLSLDARLVNHEKPRHTILTLLDLIQDNLQAAVEFDNTNVSSKGACSSSATGEVPNYTHSINLDTPISISNIEHLKYPFQGLEAAIQRLNLVSSLIDHSSRKGRQRRLEALNDHAVTESTLSFFTDASRFESLAQAIIGHLWSGISGHVVMKLARSVLHRKQRIAYTRYRKQARQTPRSQGSRAQTEGSHPLTTPSLGDGARLQLHPNLDSKLPPQAKQVPSEWLRPSTVDGESFARGQLRLSRPSSDSRKTHSVWTRNIAYPKAPKAHSASESRMGHAPCPFCQNIFSYQLYEDSDWWRTHVDGDLQPYVCVSDECSQPPRTFSNHNKWLEHMNDAHGPRWVVNIREISYRGTSEVIQEGKESPSCPMCLYDPPNTIQRNATKTTQPLELKDTERTPIVRFQEPEETLGGQSRNPNLSHPRRHLLKASDTNLSRHIAEHLKMLCFRMLSIDTNLSQETNETLESGTSSKGMKDSQTTTQTTSPSGMDSEMGKISLNFEETGDITPPEVASNVIEQRVSERPGSGPKFVDVHEATGRSGSKNLENSILRSFEWRNAKQLSERAQMASDTLFAENTPQVASESLLHILIDSHQTDALNNARRYIPRHVLNMTVTRGSVKAALKKSTSRLKLWSPSTTTMVDTIFSKDLKLLFVILLFLDIPWDVKKLNEAGFTDADLPMKRLKSKEGDRLQSGLDSKKLFTPPKHWLLQTENFVNKQWVVMAPIFGSSGEYQKLHTLCPLPLTKVDDVAHGARTVVYKAEIQSSHQRGFEAQTSSLKIAIKEFRHKMDFNREQSNLSALRTLPNTKHIAQSLAAYSQGDRYYIISPWADGGDLHNFWQTSHSGAMRTSQLALWSLDQMLGVTKAVRALHTELGDAVNCRHGDLKPGNILHFTVGKKQGDLGILKITDFGISRIHQEATFDRLNKPTVTGAASPSYEAPEVFMSLHARSRKYDIWSIGCIFLEFVVWLVHDLDAVRSFANARKSTSAHAGGAIPSFFYRIDKDDVVVHPEVFKIIKTLGRIPQSAPNTALGELMSIIKEDLIKIDPAERTDAKGLCNQLEAIVSKARSDPVYLWDSRY